MKTLRYIGMALLAVALSVNFTACSNDDDFELAKVIHVETAGTLSTMMSEEEMQVTDLTLSGFLDGGDINFIIKKLTRLKKADFTDAHIVGGGDKYYSNIGEELTTSDNVFPNSFFIQNNILQEIKIPNSVTTIGYNAFSYCTSLTSIEFPNSSVATINAAAFIGCTSLTSIEIPNSVTYIDTSVFSYCTSLTSIEIPNSVTSIGGGAFSYCTSLTSIEIPNSVTTIGGYAFRGCTSLTSIEIPNSVTRFSSYAFEDCTALKDLHVKNPTPPTVSDNSSSTYAYVTLYVPVGSKDAYMQHQFWGRFGNIIEE